MTVEPAKYDDYPFALMTQFRRIDESSHEPCPHRLSWCQLLARVFAWT